MHSQPEVSTAPSSRVRTGTPTFSIDTQNPSPASFTRATDTQPPPHYYEDEKWLDLDPQPVNTTFSQSWTIGDVVVDYAAGRELFRQYVCSPYRWPACLQNRRFEDFYLPHIPILEPVTSLNALYQASPFLFWGIIFTASHHHPRHSPLYMRLHEPYQNLLGRCLVRQIHLLKDLHALLLICHWPFEIESQQEDPSWIHCGIAVNTGLYLGLNRLEDEAMFDARRADRSLLVSNLLQASHPQLDLWKRQQIAPPKSKYRRMTWMKCFQISTQYVPQYRAFDGLFAPVFRNLIPNVKTGLVRGTDCSTLCPVCTKFLDSTMRSPFLENLLQ
jgi:hypothetical protein